MAKTNRSDEITLRTANFTGEKISDIISHVNEAIGVEVTPKDVLISGVELLFDLLFVNYGRKNPHKRNMSNQFIAIMGNNEEWAKFIKTTSESMKLANKNYNNPNFDYFVGADEGEI